MRSAWLVIAALLVAGCSSVPQSERPAPLPAYNKDVRVKASWSHILGAWKDTPEGRVRPVVADGMLMVVDGLNWLRAYDAHSGSLRWEQRTGLAITGGIGVAGESLLVGTRRGQVVAFSVKDGHVLWRTSVSSEVLAPPAVADGVAVIRSGDGKLFGLNAQDGKQLWMFERSVPALSLHGTGSAVIADGEVFAGLASGKLVALNLKDGSLLWEVAVATPQGRSELERMVDVDADPLVVGDTVYAVAYQGRVVALERSTGRELWARDMSSYHNISADAHALYLSDAQGNVWALDRSSGAALWKQEKLRNRSVSAPVLFGDFLVVADFQGYLYWLAKDDGRLVGRYHEDDAGVVDAPYPADNLLYVLDRSGAVAALRAQ
jgi:outer membrane protein assembly factor BamB